MKNLDVQFSEHFLRAFDEPDQSDGPLMLAAAAAGGQHGVYMYAEVRRDGDDVTLIVHDAWPAAGPYLMTDIPTP